MFVLCDCVGVHECEFVCIGYNIAASATHNNHSPTRLRQVERNGHYVVPLKPPEPFQFSTPEEWPKWQLQFQQF